MCPARAGSQLHRHDLAESSVGPIMFYQMLVRMTLIDGTQLRRSGQPAFEPPPTISVLFLANERVASNLPRWDVVERWLPARAMQISKIVSVVRKRGSGAEHRFRYRRRTA